MCVGNVWCVGIGKHKKHHTMLGIVLVNYDNIIANNQLMKLNWSIVIALSTVVIEDDLHGITSL